MPIDASVSIERWLNAVIPDRWPGAQASAVMQLRGDASSRRFWRLTIAGAAAPLTGAVPSSAIAIDLGPDDLPLYARVLGLLPEPLAEPPWLNVHRYLESIGAAVPQVYCASTSARMLLVEDVGETPLFEAALRGKADDLYRLAIDELLILHLDGTARIDSRCFASKIVYDERLFRWELEQFAELGLAIVAPGANRTAIDGELDLLAARLGRYPRVLSHRDYHGHNLFLQARTGTSPRIRVIDFQDALFAPAAQDLAVLLTTRDTARIITPPIERRILDYYAAALLRRGAAHMSQGDFLESYRLCVLQHALKVVGRFTVLEHEGKSGYAAYIPWALGQARRMLAQTTDFPHLIAALAT